MFLKAVPFLGCHYYEASIVSVLQLKQSGLHPDLRVTLICMPWEPTSSYLPEICLGMCRNPPSPLELSLLSKPCRLLSNIKRRIADFRKTTLSPPPSANYHRLTYTY